MNQKSAAISLILVAGTLLVASTAIPAAYADKTASNNCVKCKNRIGEQDNSQTTNNIDNSVDNTDNSVDNTVNNIDNTVNNVDNTFTATCRDLRENAVCQQT